MDAEYFICANESCGRLFSKYRPRATDVVTRLKTGWRYCSPWCRDAQKQREYRRRKSAGQPAASYRRRPPRKAEEGQ